MTKQLNILFIDDDEVERMKFNRVCSTSGYSPNVVEAINGEDALSKLQNPKSDLIFLDLNMPKMNGIEFLRTLKSDKNLKHIPAIVLSSSNNHSDLKACYELGIAGYIIKPLHFEDYTKNITTMLEYWTRNELLN